MKKRSSILLSLVTLSVLAFGLFLPEIIITQNIGTALSTKQYAVETIELDAQAKPIPIPDALRLVSGEYKNISLEPGLKSGNMLNAQGAYQSALKVLTFIVDYGIKIDLQAYTVHKETPFLLFTEDGENVTVIWQCEFTNTANDNTIVIQIDDETGKMLSFQFIDSIDIKQQSSVSAIKFSADNWADMCMRYYGFKSAKTRLQEDIDTDADTSTDTNSDTSADTYDLNTHIQMTVDTKYELMFTDADGENLVLPYYEIYLDNTMSSTDKQENIHRKMIRFNI